MTGIEATKYVIELKRSKFTVRVRTAGVLSAFGHDPTLAIRDFEGESTFAPDALEEASLHLKVNAASLETVDDLSSEERQYIDRVARDEVLEVSQYPEILFTSTAISGENVSGGWYRVIIKGDLSLHGVTAQASIDAQIWLLADSFRAHGEFKIKQSDYQIKPIDAAAIFSVSRGVIRVKDDLEVSFDMVARRVQP